MFPTVRAQRREVSGIVKGALSFVEPLFIIKFYLGIMFIYM
jgi:hypothetical protein